jgi:hypothetical protein
VGIDDTHQAALNRFPRFGPGDFDMLPISLHQRLAQSVWILMKRFECGSLGTNKPPAKNIFLITTNLDDFLIFYGDRKATRCLTERTSS